MLGDGVRTEWGSIWGLGPLTNPLKNAPEPQEKTVALSLTQAAKAAKISKSTLSVAIQKGRLSAVSLPDGSYQIEPVELFRVFPPKPDTTATEQGVRSAAEPPANRAEHVVPNPVSTLKEPDVPTEVAVLRLKVQMLEDQIARSDRERETVLGTVEDLRRRLDEEREERRGLQRLLAAPERTQDKLNAVSVVTEPPKRARGFLARLLGT